MREMERNGENISLCMKIYTSEAKGLKKTWES